MNQGLRLCNQGSPHDHALGCRLLRAVGFPECLGSPVPRPCQGRAKYRGWAAEVLYAGQDALERWEGQHSLLHSKLILTVVAWSISEKPWRYLEVVVPLYCERTPSFGR
jgi:hypothetical protein